jgi:uncharacterized protein YecE (DUF72 family)
MFDTVELQTPFYKLPQLETAQRWKTEFPNGFVPCSKAWQAITHPTTSPTWRRSGLKPEELRSKEYGLLRPTRDNFEAWERTRAVCEAAGVRVCVIQCPASFKATEENIANMRAFLSKIERGQLIIAWEPRGEWLQKPELVKKLCKKLDLVHAVDPLRLAPQHLGKRKIAYFRLHGFGKPSMYNYKYSADELKRLAHIVSGLEAHEVFCMFNNVHMLDDARRFKRILAKL